MLIRSFEVVVVAAAAFGIIILLTQYTQNKGTEKTNSYQISDISRHYQGGGTKDQHYSLFSRRFLGDIQTANWMACPLDLDFLRLLLFFVVEGEEAAAAVNALC